MIRFERIKLFLTTLIRLGVGSIVRILVYRSLHKVGHYQRALKIKSFKASDNFILGNEKRISPDNLCSSQNIVTKANNLVAGTLQYFSHFDYHFEQYPEWFFDPINRKYYYNKNHWADIDEFGFTNSDVKILWEASRFTWAPTLGQAYILTNNQKYLTTLNNWINNWCAENPPNQGIQWKCAQETSIRLLHFISTLKILNETQSCQPRCVEFVEHHLERIISTTYYAQAQRNNHLTSEAVALYVGGSWLLSKNDLTDRQQKFARKSIEKGNRLLEWACDNLIYSDGSFSQHSPVYHRIMLDVFCFCEIWRRHLKMQAFSNQMYSKLKAASDWLFWFTDPLSGDVPNMGGNDGAHILNYGVSKYRNFKSIVQLSGLVFHGKTYYEAGEWDDHAKWLLGDIKKSEYAIKKRVSKLFPIGGYYIAVSQNDDNTWFLFRLPYYKDRPAHSDAMHFDLWSKGKNILIDAGTYSYSSGDQSLLNSFKGVVGHNTVQFDGKDQMPVIGRFLFGSWLRGEWSVSGDQRFTSITCKYVDYRKNIHSRIVYMNKYYIEVIDKLSGPATDWCLRWNLGEGGEKIEKISANCWMFSGLRTELSSDTNFTSNCETKSFHSLKYLQVKQGSSIQVRGELNGTAKIITKIQIEDEDI